MRPFILTALLLTTAAPVLAQLPPPDVSQERHDDRRDGDHRDADHRGDYQGNRRDGDHRGDDRGGYRGDDRRGDDRRGDDRRDGGYRGDDRRDYRQDGRRDFRDDRRGYGEADRYARFHGDRYDYPRGYGYRAYGIGTILPRAFFDQRYYIVRPDYYRLPPAFAGTRWVRVGPDALLIRNYDGRVVRVINGLFY